MGHRGERGRGGGPDGLARRIGRGQLRVGGLQLLEGADQQVVLDVGNLGRVLGMVEIVVMADQGPELLDPLFNRLVHRLVDRLVDRRFSCHIWRVLPSGDVDGPSPGHTVAVVSP